MKKEKKFEEVGLELVEMPGVDLRQVMKNNEEAIQSLSAFAQPLRPLELVHPPVKVPTTICFEVDPEFLTGEIEVAKRRKAARELHWFELVALFSVAFICFVKLGVLDLLSRWT
jgi:hypothetical protein